MPRNGSGDYNLPSSSWNPAVDGQAAETDDWNSLAADLSDAISGSIAADGQTPITADIPFSGHTATGLRAASANGEPVRYDEYTANNTSVAATFVQKETKNYLVNSDCSVGSTSGVTVTDGTYSTLRMWKHYSQTGSNVMAQQGAQEVGMPYNGRLTQSQASAQRMGVAQFISSASGGSYELRGKMVTFQVRVRLSTSANLRCAIATNTSGTMNDPVNDWTSSTYTAGNFFISTSSFTPTVSSAQAMVANTWANISVTATLSSALLGLYVFFWTEGTAAQNVTLDWSQAQLIIGSSAPTYIFESPPQTELRVMQYYEQSVYLGDALTTNFGIPNAYRFSQFVGAAAGQTVTFVRYRVTKRTPPTVTIYNPDAANNQIRNVTGSSDWTSSSAASTESADQGFAITGTSAAGSSAGQNSRFHWSADCQP